MGVYRILVKPTGLSFLGFSTDTRARMNRHRAELRRGAHRNPELQAAWRELGEEALAFEVLDKLEHGDKPPADPAGELLLLARLRGEDMEARGCAVRWVEPLPRQDRAVGGRGLGLSGPGRERPGA
jgi:hypothetical protein